MKILQLSAENFKRISVVEITPSGNLVQITGRNAQGKTSVLDAIWVTLAGATHLQAVPIRKGADKATLQLKLGGDKVEMIATRTIRKRKEAEGFTTTLTVESAEGFRAPQPQDMLDKLLGSLTFDPLAFTRKKPKEQFEELRAFVPGVDFDKITKDNDRDYAKRTEVNRDAKRARSAEEGVQVPDSIDDTTQPVDEAALITELSGAAEHNATIERRKERRAEAQEKIDGGPTRLKTLEDETNAAIQANQDDLDEAVRGWEAEIARFQCAIADARSSSGRKQAEIAVRGSIAYADAGKFFDDLRATVDDAPPLPEPIDTDALTANITEARQINAAIRLRDQRDAHRATAERLEAEATALTEAMATREKTKAEAIANAELPVAGLGFGDGAVTINGLPFDQASDAEQLRTSIAIAMAANPKLRVIRVRDGSLLDDDALKLLAEMAQEKDYQVWLERVSSDGKTGFVLEDGHLAEVKGALL